MPHVIAAALPLILASAGTATTAGSAVAPATAAGLTGLTAAQLAKFGAGASALGGGLSTIEKLFNPTTPPVALPSSGAISSTSSTPSAPFLPPSTPGIGLSPTSAFNAPAAGAPTGQAAVQAALQAYGGEPGSGDPYGGGFNS